MYYKNQFADNWPLLTILFAFITGNIIALFLWLINKLTPLFFIGTTPGSMLVLPLNVRIQSANPLGELIFVQTIFY